MRDDNQYILSVGKAGKPRLDKLHKLLLPSTNAFLQELNIKEDYKILEIGCGRGNVTSNIGL